MTRPVAAALALCLLASAAPSKAQAEKQLGLFVAPDVEHVDRERLRAAVAAELGIAVALRPASERGDVLSISRRGDKAVVVTYRGEGRSVTRAIDVPERTDAAVEAVALLAGNLVRDEASEVIASLRARPDAAEYPSSPVAEPPADAPAPAAPPPQAPPPVVVVAKPPKPAAGAPAATAAAPCSRRELTVVPLGGDFAPMLGSSSIHRATEARKVSINFVGLTGGVDGVETAALVNIDTHFSCGAQASGIANVVGGPVRGVQVSGVANFATGPVEGAQVAGVFNGARDVAGAQVGVVNVAGVVRGVQVGVFNYAEDSDASIGVVSIVRRGRTQIQAWATEWQFVGAGIKHGSRRVHGIYGAGVRAPLSADQSARPVLALGLGVRFEPSESLWVDLDLVAHQLVPTDSGRREIGVGTLGALVGYKLTRSFSVFVAPTYNVGLAPDEADVDDLSRFGDYELHRADGLFFRGWPGLVLGAQLL